MKVRKFTVILALVIISVLLVIPFAQADREPINQAGSTSLALDPVISPEKIDSDSALFAPPAAPNKQSPTQAAATSTENALQKIHPDLRDLARTSSPALPNGTAAKAVGPESIFIEVISLVIEKNGQVDGLDLSPYFIDNKVMARPPFGSGATKLQMSFGYIHPAKLLKIASYAQVEAILPVTHEVDDRAFPYPPDEPRQIPTRGPEDWAKLRVEADKWRANAPNWVDAKAIGDGKLRPETRDWFEVLPEGPHKAQAAWERGYTGERVTVAVLDDGIDAAHSDLIGTQKIYSSTVNSQYNGWPMVFSPFSMLLYAQDFFFGTTFVQNGFPSIHYVDTSETPTLTPAGLGISEFTFTPLINYLVPGSSHRYIIANDMTLSGVIHVGTHPDNDLRDFILGEKPAVLVTDPNVPGVYDTVYVDLDNDYDFRDEKPLTRADVNDPGTYNNMIAYRDLNSDGITDISGGMVYFIGNGIDAIPGSDWMYGPFAPPPGNGDLVAFSGSSFDRPYSHGTQCASNVVSQGVVDGRIPDFIDANPQAAVYGMAPDAEMVNISDIYWNFSSSVIDAYSFVAVGYDGIFSFDSFDTDGIQITSNSYGNSAQDNDGWDFEGQYVTQIQRYYAPYTQFMFSTGNGAPAYGTTAPPSPATGITVGASTQFGSTGWDSITSTTQIMHSDVTPFSNRGPGARGTAGVDVVAGGAFAGGLEEMNYFSTSNFGSIDGNLAWSSWGGTSRSAPVAMGVMALIYQAYYDANGVWPTHDVAKALLMSTATDLDYDTQTQGAGSVNADRGTAVAGGHYGLYVEGGAPVWQPGDYRGVDYPGFAHVAYPGDTFNKTFTVHNSGTEPITVGLDDVGLKLIGSEEVNLTVTPEMVATEVDNFFKGFNYFIPITATAGKDAAWYNIDIPADTDLMIIRQRFPFDQFDSNGDYVWDNRFYLVVYNWTDIDGDGIVWDDKNSNGVVNFVNGTTSNQIDGAVELLWNDPATEIDRWEFGRFSYHRPTGNRNEMWIQNPLDRMTDGLFIGLRHHPGSTFAGTTNLSYRIDFYREEDVNWLDVGTLGGGATLAAGASADFVATVTVPNDAKLGSYQAAIQVWDPGLTAPITQTGLSADNTANVSIIPVQLSVAADFSDGLQLGGMEQYLAETDMPYNNAAVRGLHDWSWRAESGDWRFFFVDIDNEPTNVLFSESFEGAFPPSGWSTVDNAGSGLTWFQSATNNTSGSGFSAAADSNAFCSVGAWDTELWSPPLDLSSLTTPMLRYASNFQDFAGAGQIWLDISTDGGTTWTNLRYQTSDDPPGGTIEEVNLSAYSSQTITLRWRYTDDGDTCAWFWHIDDVTIFDVASLPYTAGTQMLIKDEWADGGSIASTTDIDTLVLGPTPTSLGLGSLGIGANPDFSFGEESYFGPYILDTVGGSPNTNAGAGIWIFDTSTGRNEDWVVAPLQDGLHEILQHNVLHDGEQFDVVFTKTLGTAFATPLEFEIAIQVDQGEVGDLTIQSSLPLNGLVADAFGLGGPEFIVDEPISFVDSNTFEWTDTFVVDHGAKIELSTSSANIADIDLYLFYCGPTGTDPCVQRAASTSGTAVEFVQIILPEDGVWLIAVNNWSGPAGTFNLTKVVVQGDDLSVSGLPTGTVPADTPVTVTIDYSRTMEAGLTYEGLLLLGPPEAPSLVEVPIVINKTAAVEKVVDKPTAFLGDELTYTITVNPDGISADFDLVDPIPVGTEFITVTNATYNASSNQIEYASTLDAPDVILLTVRVISDDIWVTNTATVNASGALTFGPVTASASTEVKKLAAINIEKTAPSQVLPGSTIAYQITVSNTGQTIAENVTLVDTMPTDTTFVTGSALIDGIPSLDFAYDGGQNEVAWTGTLLPGEGKVFSFLVSVDSGLTGSPESGLPTVTNIAEASWNGETYTASATTQVSRDVYLPFVSK